MKIGISLLRARPDSWFDVAQAADELGFESVWISDHLVLPVDQDSPYPGAAAHNTGKASLRSAPVASSLPLFDCTAYLSAIAARTSRVRLGTYVYLLGVRHPLVTARAWQTVDLISAGRVELGVGAGWLESEWRCAGLDFATRGPALEEAITVCRRLWTEQVVEHQGETWQFEPVYFEPKPVQPGGPPVLVGGESPAAMRRTARIGDGWIAMEHTTDTIAPKIDQLRRLLDEAGRPHDQVPVTVGGAVETPEDLDRWTKAGVDRVITTPWARSRDAIPALEQLADRLGLNQP